MKTKTVWLVGLLSTSFLASAEQSLDEVLAEYVEARGGIEAIESMKTMKTTGKMIMGPMEAPFAFTFKTPNKIHTTFEIQGMKGIQAFDGEKGWQVMPFMGKSEPVVMSEEELKQIKEQADIQGPLINAEAKGTTLELIGNTEIEGTPVIEIKATKKNGDVIHIFLDEEYKLEVMSRAKMTAMGQEVEAETYYSDYKEVGEYDSPVAHSMAIKVNGTTAQNLSFENVEFNIDVDDALFAMPVVESAPETAEAKD